MICSYWWSEERIAPPPALLQRLDARLEGLLREAVATAPPNPTGGMDSLQGKALV